MGKYTAALEAARVLLDPAARQAVREHDAGDATRLIEGGGDSRIQNLIHAGTHPDLHIIRKEMAKFSDNRSLRDKKQLNIPIDLLRERVIGGKSGETYHDAAAYRTAQMGHGKVFIIDEAELLDQTGQNAMLKTLEEPPSDTWFFLITSQPDRLLPTILSRCQHVRFGRLDEQAMKHWMKSGAVEAARQKRPEDERPLLSGAAAAKELQWSLEYADGSPGVALLALEYGFYNWQTTLEPMLADLERGNFPASMGEALSGFVEEFAQQWVKTHGKQTTSKDAANKDGAKHVFALVAAHLRRRLASDVEAGTEVSNWMRMIDLLRDAERQLESNVNVKMLMENLVVQWSLRTPSAAA